MKRRRYLTFCLLLLVILIAGGCINPQELKGASSDQQIDEKNDQQKYAKLPFNNDTEINPKNIPWNGKNNEADIIPAERKTFQKYEKLKNVASFSVKVPTEIPREYKLVRIEYFRPKIDVPKTAHNDFVLATYSDGQNELTIRQGYFSGENVPIPPQGKLKGKVKVQGVVGNWVQGRAVYIQEPTKENAEPPAKWEDQPLQLGWSKDGIGYRISATNLSLDQLVSIGNSLKNIK